MEIPHIIVVEEILPEVRRRTARSLYLSGLSQDKIANLLGVSQAMVSRYLKESKKNPPSLDRLIRSITSEIEVAIIASGTKEDLVDRFCLALERSMSRGEMITRYEERFGAYPVKACFGFRGPGLTRSRIIEDLLTSVSYLIERPIPDLIPAVKVNIAYALDEAGSLDEVAAFPGRIPDICGKIIKPLSPEFGVSRHLAGVLMNAMAKDDRIRSAMNLAARDNHEAIIRELGDCSPLDGNIEPSSGDNVNSNYSIRYMVDPGGFGIEPCLYIFASSPLELARFAVRMQEEYEKR